MIDSFVFLGNTRFGELFQREHAFAIELAKHGYNVGYVEGMPSIASRARDLLSKATTSKSAVGNLKLEILTPPTVPTFFRSSWTPGLDALLFRRWFERTFSGWNWSTSALMVMFPYWWSGFVDKDICNPPLIVYDVCDSLQVPARNANALSRMGEAEARLVAAADIVTTSAESLRELLLKNYPGCRAVFVSNGVSEEFLVAAEQMPAQKINRATFGYAGSLDPRWFDTELIEALAGSISDSSIRIVGPVNAAGRRRLGKQTGIELVGTIKHSELLKMYSEFSAGLIPFQRNAVTDLVNPIKLYEYFAFGIPVVATRTKELERFSDLVYLASNKTEFTTQAKRAVSENSLGMDEKRRMVARENSWPRLTEKLISVIRSKTAAW